MAPDTPTTRPDETKPRTDLEVDDLASAPQRVEDDAVKGGVEVAGGTRICNFCRTGTITGTTG